MPLLTSLILTVCATRVIYELRNGPYSPKSLCDSVVVNLGAVVSFLRHVKSFVYFYWERFFIVYLSSLSYPLYKVKILRTFLFGRKLFQARHVIKMLGHIFKNWPVNIP